MIEGPFAVDCGDCGATASRLLDVGGPSSRSRGSGAAGNARDSVARTASSIDIIGPPAEVVDDDPALEEEDPAEVRAGRLSGVTEVVGSDIGCGSVPEREAARSDSSENLVGRGGTAAGTVPLPP